MNEDIIFNVLQDFSKKEITTTVKGLFVKEIMKKEGLSERGFSEKYGIPKSTIHDWISGRQMTKYYLMKKNEIFYHADRLCFLLSKDVFIDEKSKLKLGELKVMIE